MNATITVVKVKGNGIRWAQKCVPHGSPDKPRYRGYYYKAEALRGLEEWQAYDDMSRNYWHNFFSTEELGIVES